MNLYLIPQDKANHIIYGALVFIIAAFLASLAGLPRVLPPLWVGLVAAVAVGVFKEAVDYFANQRAIAADLAPVHTVDPLDAMATTAGGLLCFIAARVV